MRMHVILEKCLLVVAVLTLLSGCTSGGPGGASSPSSESSADPSMPSKLNFGIIATESTIGLKDEFEPFLEDMSKELGIPVRAFFASDYAGVIEAMRFKKVDLGWFGNKSAIEAADRAGGEVFAQIVPSNGTAGYWSTLIVHVDSPYKDVDELLRDASNLAFGNGDPHSTSGFLVPTYYLWRERGIDPKKAFKVVVNANHETNALSVASKQVHVATCSTEVLAQLESQKPDMYEKLRIIWKSPLIASDPFVWRKDLSDELKKRVSDFVLQYGKPGPKQEHQRAVLANISAGWLPLQASSDDQLIPFREMMLANKIDDLESKGDSLTNQQASELSELKKKLQELKDRALKVQSDLLDEVSGA